MTNFAIDTGDSSARLAAFWAADDRYYVRATGTAGTQWYCLEEAPEVEASVQARARLGELLANVFPIGGGRVAFPVGSTGRTVFRVWRSGGASNRSGRTKILAVRAARSRRLPA